MVRDGHIHMSGYPTRGKHVISAYGPSFCSFDCQDHFYLISQSVVFYWLFSGVTISYRMTVLRTKQLIIEISGPICLKHEFVYFKHCIMMLRKKILSYLCQTSLTFVICLMIYTKIFFCDNPQVEHPTESSSSCDMWALDMYKNGAVLIIF